jgi:2-polyprenyl-3-methyl-5-hydroxy-6-metoxy-1,4-benzoquinol methylase
MWWRVGPYGMAECFPDTAEMRKRVDAEPAGWYGNVEGTIKHGGVIATAFQRKTEQAYSAPYPGCADFSKWVPNGTVTTTTITAEADPD